MSSEVVDSPPEDWLDEAIRAWEQGDYPAATAAATIAMALVAIHGARRCPESDEYAQTTPVAPFYPAHPSAAAWASYFPSGGELP